MNRPWAAGIKRAVTQLIATHDETLLKLGNQLISVLSPMQSIKRFYTVAYRTALPRKDLQYFESGKIGDRWLQKYCHKRYAIIHTDQW